MFGEAIYVNGSLNRKEVAARVFSDPDRITSYNVCYTKLLRIYPMPMSIQFIGYSPNLKVASNITHIKKINMGKPNKRWVTKLSMVSVP